LERDVDDRQVRITEQRPRALYPARQQIAVRRKAKRLLEAAREVGL
jgi:hypothetical protein